MLPHCRPNVAPMLFQGCYHVAFMRCFNVAPMWPQCCPNVASMLPQCCPNVAPMWPQCCPYGAPMLPPSGGSIHFVGRPQTKNQKLSKNTKNWNHQCSGNVCAPMWPQCGPMLPQCCPNVAPMLPQCCPNVAPMLPQCWLNVTQRCAPEFPLH